MSHIGKKTIEIKKGAVDVKISNGEIEVKGVKGSLKRKIPKGIRVVVENDILKVIPIGNSKEIKSLWGLIRSLVFNMVQGVEFGFEKKLEVKGIGYKAALEGKDLVLEAGFTHPVKVESPDGIVFKIEKNIITIAGIDKELVGQTAANIRKIRKPEPYKGKGIRYLGEVVTLKAGKKAATTT